MTLSRKRLALSLLVVLATACAPAYAHIYSSAQGGDNTVTTMSGPQPVQSTWTVDASHQTRNYTGTAFTDTRTGGADGVSRYALRVRGAGDLNGLYGCKIDYQEGSTNWDDWHYRSGLKVEQHNFVADRCLIRNEGDAAKVGVNGTQQGDNFRLSRTWVDQSHDDCFQNDEGLDGLVLEANLFQDCYNGISARPSAGSNINASAATILLDGNVLSVSDKTSCYNPASYGCPNHAGWLKWDTNTATALRIALWNNTFAATTYPEIGSLALNAPVTTAGNGGSDDCHGNVIDWLGPTTGSEWTSASADFATWLPRCPDTIVNTGTAASTHYFNAVQAFHNANPGVG